MERKTSVKDIHKKINGDIPDLYNSLCDKLGDRNPFAKFNIGAGNYVWSDNSTIWSRIIEASDLKQSIIKEAIIQIKEEVAAKVGKDSAEVLFTVPDESYIYYNDEGSDVRILITGWGFKKPVRVSGSKDIKDLPRVTKNPINITFTNDGEKLINYEFGIKLPRQIKHFTTNSSGLFTFPDLKVGEKYIIKNLCTDDEYPLNIVQGQSLYEFDVTRYSTLTITATSDGLPVINELVKVQYYGKSFEVNTNGDGVASLQLPLHEGETITALWRELKKCEDISAGGIKIDFVLESPKMADVYISVIKNNQKIPSQAIEILYGDSAFEGVTDSNGEFHKQFVYIPQKTCRVVVQDYEPQSKQLVESSVNYFKFEKTTAPEITRFLPHILTKGINGEIMGNYHISVEYEGISNEYVSNSNGIVPLPEMENGKTMIVKDKNHISNIINYVLNEEQIEYVFVIPEDLEERTIKIMFRDIKGNPIVCKNVRFQQEGHPDYLIQLDENGDTLFKDGTFDIDTPINTRIIGWDNLEQYHSIPFSLEKDEYEYLLQEKAPQSNSAWWKIAFEIFLVLLCITFFYLIWPFLEALFMSIFNSLYY